MINILYEMKNTGLFDFYRMVHTVLKTSFNDVPPKDFCKTEIIKNFSKSLSCLLLQKLIINNCNED